MIKAMVTDQHPGYGKQGYYLASSGKVLWDDIYASIAKALKKRGVISSCKVQDMTDGALAQIAAAQGVETSSVRVKMAGRYDKTENSIRIP
jgi:hypothetical protein